MPINVFAHATAEKSDLYRAVMAVFAAANACFVPHLRPDEVVERLRATHPGVGVDEVQALLQRLAGWGNLLAGPDTGRVSTVEDFHRARYHYRISAAGEAAEQALSAFDQLADGAGALRTSALADIRTDLRALRQLALQAEPAAIQVNLLLRDLLRAFTGMADAAAAFMAGLDRAAEREASPAAREHLIAYLERFLGELVVAAAEIGTLIRALDGPPVERLLAMAAERDARDRAPDPREGGAGRRARALADWRARWEALRVWFISEADRPSRESLLRGSARKAITRLTETLVRLNERRLGRSDRCADFRTLALWFAECATDGEAHRLWRAAFGLTPARHLSVDLQTLAAREQAPVAADTPWAQAAPLRVSPRLRATGSFQRRGALPKVRRHDREKALLARQLAAEAQQTRRARARLARGVPMRLSELGELDADSFGLFLRLLGEALAAAPGPAARVETVTGDGSLRVELEPLGEGTRAQVVTPAGTFSGRDYRVCITDLDGEGMCEVEG